MRPTEEGCAESSKPPKWGTTNRSTTEPPKWGGAAGRDVGLTLGGGAGVRQG